MRPPVGQSPSAERRSVSSLLVGVGSVIATEMMSGRPLPLRLARYMALSARIRSSDVMCFARSDEGGADAGPDRDIRARESKRCREGLVDSGRKQRDVVHAVHLLAQEDELVSGESCQRVAGPDQPGEAMCNGDQKLVADHVTEGVVDVLEMVEIEKQDRRAHVGSFRPGCGMLESFLQQKPVGQAGQRVVHRVVVELIGGGQ